MARFCFGGQNTYVAGSTGAMNTAQGIPGVVFRKYLGSIAKRKTRYSGDTDQTTPRL